MSILEITTHSVPSSSTATIECVPISNSNVVSIGNVGSSHVISVNTSGIVEVSNDAIGVTNVGEAEVTRVAPNSPRTRSIFSSFFDGNPQSQD